MDQWTENELKYLSLGGNTKFADYLKEYEVADEELQKKYKTCAAYYYRLKLDHSVQSKEFK